MKKKVVVALGHRALGTTLPEQQIAVRKTVKSIADLVQDGYQVVITHSNAPQLGMIHTAMNEFGKNHPDYTPAPMSVCSAMTQGYVGFDLQNAIREELLTRGIYRTVSTILTQVTVDPYDEAFYTPTKVLGRYMSAEDAAAERKKGNYVVEEPGKGFRRVVSAPNPVKIVELDAIRTLSDADQVVIACGGGGIPVTVIFVVLAGMCAISAMVLPGISGSTILLTFGLYMPVITGIKEFLHLNFEYFGLLCSLGIGIILGVFITLRLIKKALEKFRSQTIYCVIGMMIGSLYAIVIGPTTLKEPKDPMSFGTFSIVFFIIGAAIVFGIQVAKSVYDKKQLAKAEEKIEEE